MKEYNNLEEVCAFCKALGSDIRMSIVKLLSEHKKMNIHELSEALGVTNGAMTAHIKALLSAGIIDIQLVSGKRGSQKLCVLKEHKFLIDFSSPSPLRNMYQVEMPVGSYTNYNVFPTCGLATVDALIGEVDDPRYFDDPRRSHAGILWFTKGFIEYRIPNYLRPNQKPLEIQISLEIASEAPGACDDWPSDIYFYANGKCLGFWTSPGDFANHPGLYNPDWWLPNWNQYGLLKLLTINKAGSYVDGLMISATTIEDLKLDHLSDIVFRMAVPTEAANAGGLTIFGKGFGNYSQAINVRVIYDELSISAGSLT